MFWNLFPLKYGKYSDNYLAFMDGEIEIFARKHQPFRLRYDSLRKGFVVIMQGLCYYDPDTNEQLPQPWIIEDWKEVGFIPFRVESKPDTSKVYRPHTDRLFGFRQKGSNAYPKVLHGN